MSDTSKATPSEGVKQAAEIVFPWLSAHYQGEFIRQGSYGNGETRLAEILASIVDNPERDKLARKLAVAHGNYAHNGDPKWAESHGKTISAACFTPSDGVALLVSLI